MLSFSEEAELPEFLLTKLNPFRASDPAIPLLVVYPR